MRRFPEILTSQPSADPSSACEKERQGERGGSEADRLRAKWYKKANVNLIKCVNLIALSPSYTVLFSTC